MTARQERGRPSRKSGGPVLTLPPGELSTKARKQLEATIEAQWREATGTAAHIRRPFRWRFHLQPLAWLAAACAGLAAPAGHHLLVALLAAAVTILLTFGRTGGRPKFFRNYHRSMSAWAMAWGLIMMYYGVGPADAAGLLGWAVPSAFWINHYGWHPPEPGPPPPDRHVEETWDRLCAAQKWDAPLGTSRELPGGGAQWTIRCDGITTHIDKITAKRTDIAAAFHMPITQAYAEPDPTGIKSHGFLTILPGGTLEEPRHWNGLGADPRTGLIRVGRFPDGQPVHLRLFVPACAQPGGVGGGVRHTIVAGADGAGKTGLLDMTLAASLATLDAEGLGMIAPVILDPQMGQALPRWQDVLPYAIGTDDCMTYLRGLHGALFERSRELANLTWVKHKCDRRDGTDCTPRCKRRKGFNFYDYELIKAARAEQRLPPLPIIQIVVDEAPILLAMKGAPELLTDIVKLGRKTGFQLILAAQVPSIAEMGKSELRAILNGGNVFVFRTGDKLSAGMAGIPASPNELPLYWPNGSTTVGLGYAKTIENRPQVTMRTDWLEDPDEAAEVARITPPDDGVAGMLARAITMAADELHERQEEQAGLDATKRAIMKMLVTPLTRGQIIQQSTIRPSELVEALDSLFEEGRVAESGDLVRAA